MTHINIEVNFAEYELYILMDKNHYKEGKLDPINLSEMRILYIALNKTFAITKQNRETDFNVYIFTQLTHM